MSLGSLQMSLINLLILDSFKGAKLIKNDQKLSKAFSSHLQLRNLHKDFSIFEFSVTEL